MKSNKCAYKVLIGIGSLMTISYIGAIWANDVCKVILNIVAMIGSGVLCSALVSLFLELKSEKEKKKQSSFILEGIKSRLKFILIWEIKVLSAYSILIKPDSQKRTKKYKLTLTNAIVKIKEILESITQNTENIYQYSSNMDFEYMNKIKRKNTLAFGFSLPYYKDLASRISDLLIDSNNYLINGVFNEDKINILKSMEIEIKEIIGFSTEDSLELLMEFREIFFKNIEMYYKVLDIDLNEEQDCYIREIKNI